MGLPAWLVVELHFEETAANPTRALPSQNSPLFTCPTTANEILKAMSDSERFRGCTQKAEHSFFVAVQSEEHVRSLARVMSPLAAGEQ